MPVVASVLTACLLHLISSGLGWIKAIGANMVPPMLLRMSVRQAQT